MLPNDQMFIAVSFSNMYLHIELHETSNGKYPDQRQLPAGWYGSTLFVYGIYIRARQEHD